MTKARLINSVSAVACAAAAVGLGPMARAQTPQNPVGTVGTGEPSSSPSDELADIVVTARRVSENLTQVPLAITATQEIGDLTLGVIGSLGIDKWGYLQTVVGVNNRDIPNPNAAFRATIPYIYTLIKGNTKNRDRYGEIRITSPQDRRITALQTDTITPQYGINGYTVATPLTFFRNKTAGVFGSVQWEVVDSLFLSGEGRYQLDKITQQAQSTTLGVAPARGASGQPDFRRRLHGCSRTETIWRSI